MLRWTLHDLTNSCFWEQRMSTNRLVPENKIARFIYSILYSKLLCFNTVFCLYLMVILILFVCYRYCVNMSHLHSAIYLSWVNCTRLPHASEIYWKVVSEHFVKNFNLKTSESCDWKCLRIWNYNFLWTRVLDWVISSGGSSVLFLVSFFINQLTFIHLQVV